MGRAENVPLGDNRQSAEKGYHDVAISGFSGLCKLESVHVCVSVGVIPLLKA